MTVCQEEWRSSTITYSTKNEVTLLVIVLRHRQTALNAYALFSPVWNMNFERNLFEHERKVIDLTVGFI